MSPILRLILVLLLPLLSACDSSVTASKESLHGKWTADFPLSWSASREALMKTTKHGGGGHLPGSSEYEAFIKKSLEAEMKTMTLTFHADGKVSVLSMGHASEGSYQVRKIDQRKLNVTMLFGGEREYVIEFVDANQIHVTETVENAPTAVLIRDRP